MFNYLCTHLGGKHCSKNSLAKYSDLLVENRKIFIPHLYLAPPHQGLTPSEFHEDV